MLFDRRVLALVMTLAVVAVLATGLAVAQQEGEEELYVSHNHPDLDGVSLWDNSTQGYEWQHDATFPYDDLELSPGGSILYGSAAVGVDGNITAWHADTGSVLWDTDSIPSDNQRGIYPGPDGDVVVSVGEDGINVVDASDGSEIWTERGIILRDVDVTSDGEALIAAGDNGVYRYDLETGTEEWHNDDNSDIVHGMDINHETGSVYVGGRDHQIRELDPADGTELDAVSVGDRVWEIDTRADSLFASVGFTSGSVVRVDTSTSMSVDWSTQIVSGEFVTDVDSPDDSSGVYAVDGDGMMSRLDEDGSEVWDVSVGSDAFSLTVDPSFSGADVDPGPELDPQLEIDTRIWMEPGSETGYTVTHYPEYTNETRGPSEDVTGNASLTSDNSTVLSVDTDAHTLTASADNYARVRLNASYDGLETTHNVTVSPMTAEYLEIIPGPYRFTATFNETGFQIILIAIMSGVVATRLSTAFGGIGATQLVLLIGWFAGFVSLGIALVGLFTAMFIGFNLAANVDYSVRR